MSLVEIINDMNSNFENRKHGGVSTIGNLQYNILVNFGVEKENYFTSPLYFPAGEKIEEGSLDKLSELVYTNENVMGRVR